MMRFPNESKTYRSARETLLGAELLGAKADPGQNMRHVDLLWPLWGVLDLTPEGRGKDWYPKLEYR